MAWGGERFYAGGVLPIGDAFLAWARTVPKAPAAAVADGPAPRLWPFAAVPLIVGATCMWGAGRLRRRTG